MQTRRAGECLECLGICVWRNESSDPGVRGSFHKLRNTHAFGNGDRRHRHERRRGTLHHRRERLEDALWCAASRECFVHRLRNHGSIGDRIAKGKPDLDDVCARIDNRLRNAARRVEIRIASRHECDERCAMFSLRSREGGEDSLRTCGCLHALLRHGVEDMGAVESRAKPTRSRSGSVCTCESKCWTMDSAVSVATSAGTANSGDACTAR